MLQLTQFIGQFDIARVGYKTGTKWHSLTSGLAESHVGFGEGSFFVHIEHDLESADWKQVASYLSLRVSQGPTKKMGALLMFDEEYRDRFAPFMHELVEQCQQGENPLEIIQRLLPRWFRFWDEPNPPLDIKDQIALFGELEVLVRLMESGDSRPLECWRGPFDEDDLHDFQGKDGHLEVKTNSKSPRSITISSLDQMDAKKAAKDELYLIIVELERDDHGHHLPNKVSEARRMAKKAGAENKLEELLILCNYLDRHELLYSENKYNISQILIHKVGDKTPIYNSSHLKENFDQTVKRVRQLVDYSGLSISEISEKEWSRMRRIIC